MDASKRGCLANMELNSFHRNGLVCTLTLRTCYMNGVLVPATLRILVLARYNLVWNLWFTHLKSTIGPQYFTLFEVIPNVRNSDSSMAFSSWMTRVRVDKLSRGSAHSQFALFFGKLDTLFLELAHWWWPKVALFFAYLA